MAFFYIKDDGTASGDSGRYTTKQTGTFAALGTANYYGTVAAALSATTSPTNGDFILLSDLHDQSSGSNIALSGVTGLTGLPLKYQTVDDANIDQSAEATAAQITTTGGGDIDIGGANQRVSISGVYMKTDDDIRLTASNTFLIAHNCTFEATGSSDIALDMKSQDGTYAELHDCTIIIGGSGGNAFEITRGGQLKMIGGIVTRTSGTILRLIRNSSFSGGMTASFTGVDLVKVADYILAETGNNAGDDMINLELVSCELSSTLIDYSEELLYGPNKEIRVYNSTSSSSAAEYQFHINRDQHIAEDDTAFFRDNSIAFTGGQKVSIKVVTAAHADRLFPFWFNLPSRYIKLSSASTDTLRLYLLSSDSGLTDQDVWAELIYPDGTNKQTPNLLTTVNSDPLAAGTALTANSDAWTGRTSETRYQIDLDTSGDPGADSAPLLRIHIGKPSITVYFDVITDEVA